MTSTPLRERLAQSPFWAMAWLQARMAWQTRHGCGVVALWGCVVTALRLQLASSHDRDVSDFSAFAWGPALVLVSIVLAQWWVLPALLAVAVVLSHFVPTSFMPAILWLVGGCIIACAAISAQESGDHGPRGTFGEMHMAALLPMKPVHYRLASAVGRALTAVWWTLGGCAMLVATYRLDPRRGFVLPALPNWFPGAVGGFWGLAVVRLGFGLLPTDGRLQRLPLARRLCLAWYYLRLAWYYFTVWLADSLRVLNEGIPLHRLGIPEADWWLWLRPLLGAALAMAAVAGVAFAMLPGQASAIAIALGFVPAIGACVTVSLWPSTVRIAEDPYDLGRGAMDFQFLLPRPPRRLWASRLLAATVVIALFSIVPCALAQAMKLAVASPARMPELDGLTCFVGKFALCALLAWPLLPILCVPARRRRWPLVVALFVGAVIGIVSVDPLGKLGVPRPVPLLAGGAGVAALSRYLSDPNAWPLRRARPLYWRADLLGFALGMVPGIALALAGDWWAS